MGTARGRRWDQGDDGAHAEVVRWFVVRQNRHEHGGRKMIEGEMEGSARRF